jgi:hypothetical protein
MPESDPIDLYLVALRDAANLYMTDNLASRAAAITATITFVRAITDNNDRSLTTPLMDVFSRLADESERLQRENEGDEDGNRRGMAMPNHSRRASTTLQRRLSLRWRCGQAKPVVSLPRWLPSILALARMMPRPLKDC